MKDKKLLTAALLLPVTVLFLGAALAAGLLFAHAAGSGPTVPNREAETYTEIPIEITLTADDPDRNTVLFQLTEQPRLGTATIQGNTLHYAPGSRTGRDQFSYTAVDATGCTARPAQIRVRISKNKTGLTYADLSGDPAHFAALQLAARGVMTGETIGGCAFFHPSRTVSRSEFIAMATAAASLPVTASTQTDFADDSGLSPWARPFISTAAANGLVSGYRTAGGLTEIRGQNPITIAEASVILNNLLLHTTDGAHPVFAGSHTAGSDWAAQAIHTLTRLDVLSPFSAAQEKDTTLTRRTACEMLYRTMQLID